MSTHHRPFSTLAITAAASVLAACASTAPEPVPASAVAMPAAWSVADTSATQQAASVAAWWHRFGDPTLVALVEEALTANANVRSAQAALRQSRALADVQAAKLSPTLQVGGSVQSTRENGGTQNLYQAGFDAGWEPDVFGARRAASLAADLDAKASSLSLADVHISTAAEVALNYLQWRGLQTRLSIAQANLDSQTETLQITRWRQQAGLLTMLEVDQAVSARALTQAQLPALMSTSDQTRHSLAVLTGVSPQAMKVRLAISSLADPAPDQALAMAFPAATLAQRPDVQAARQRVIAAAQRVNLARANRMPSFAITGSLGLTAVTLGALAGGAPLVAGLLGSVSAPLVDGGGLRSQIRAQQAAMEQASAAYDQVLLLALKEVEDSLHTLRNDRLRIQSLVAAATAGASASQLARQRFSAGLVDFQVVLETQRNALTTQDSVAAAKTDINTDHVRLYKAVGGGWTPLRSATDTPP